MDLQSYALRGLCRLDRESLGKTSLLKRNQSDNRTVKKKIIVGSDGPGSRLFRVSSIGIDTSALGPE